MLGGRFAAASRMRAVEKVTPHIRSTGFCSGVAAACQWRKDGAVVPVTVCWAACSPLRGQQSGYVEHDFGLFIETRFCSTHRYLAGADSESAVLPVVRLRVLGGQLVRLTVPTRVPSAA